MLGPLASDASAVERETDLYQIALSSIRAA
jgi:hypothetical protein